MVEGSKTLFVDNPNKVVISIKTDTGFVEIDVTQSFSFRLEENKKPIYGYNQRHFSKVLAGKAIASGTLVIKKHAKETILSSFVSNHTNSLRKEISDNLASKMDIIYELLTTNTASESYLKSKRNLDRNVYLNDNDFLNQQLEKFSEDAIQEQVALRLSENRSLNNDDYTFDRLLRMSNITIKVSFRKPFSATAFRDSDSIIQTSIESQEGYELIFEDVSFISKDVRIVVGELTIDEAYSFIANLES